MGGWSRGAAMALKFVCQWPSPILTIRLSNHATALSRHDPVEYQKLKKQSRYDVKRLGAAIAVAGKGEKIAAASVRSAHAALKRMAWVHYD